jgi:nucleoside recognition membrane protein YjiH
MEKDIVRQFPVGKYEEAADAVKHAWILFVTMLLPAMYPTWSKNKMVRAKTLANSTSNMSNVWIFL